ncbi:MAG: M56 family metallopeptidase [Bacteroidota bacterium]
MNWLNYLLEANLYLVVFYAFYRLFLHRETFYQLNRYYLLITSVLAFLLPGCQIGYLYSLVNPALQSVSEGIPYSGTLVPIVAARPGLTFEDILYYCYLLVAGLLLLRLLKSFYYIIQLARKADKTHSGNVIQVHLKHSNKAFSFFNLLFINPEVEGQNIITEHETIHIRQKHSIDILFFETVLIFNWFNPICWLMRKDVKLVHEYIADEATTNRGLAKHDYAMFLIQNSFGSAPNPLMSQMFNQSILKHRISMLNKPKSAGRARLRLLYVLPITAGMLCTSTLTFSKDYTVIDLYSKKDLPVSTFAKKEFRQAPKQEKKKIYPIESINDGPTGTRPVKLIVINGKVSRANNFVSVNNYEQVKELNSAEAIAKYGKRAAKGALEFTGKNAGISITFPPPIPLRKRPGKPAVSNRPPQPKIEVTHFPPPLVKPMKKTEDDPGVKTTNSQKISDIGANPLYINNGNITAVNPGEGKIVSFKAKSARVTPKNNLEAIAKYGEKARDGVIELEDGEFYITDAKTIKP